MSKLKTSFNFNQFEVGDWVKVTALVEVILSKSICDIKL